MLVYKYILCSYKLCNMMALARGIFSPVRLEIIFLMLKHLREETRPKEILLIKKYSKALQNLNNTWKKDLY